MGGGKSWSCWGRGTPPQRCPCSLTWCYSASGPAASSRPRAPTQQGPRVVSQPQAPGRGEGPRGCTSAARSVALLLQMAIWMPRGPAISPDPATFWRKILLVPGLACFPPVHLEIAADHLGTICTKRDPLVPFRASEVKGPVEGEMQRSRSFRSLK